MQIFHSYIPAKTLQTTLTPWDMHNLKCGKESMVSRAASLAYDQLWYQLAEYSFQTDNQYLVSQKHPLTFTLAVDDVGINFTRTGQTTYFLHCKINTLLPSTGLDLTLDSTGFSSNGEWTKWKESINKRSNLPDSVGKLSGGLNMVTTVIPLTSAEVGVYSQDLQTTISKCASLLFFPM